MNFSKLKLNEGIATSGGTQSSLDAAAKSSELSTNSAAERFNRKSIVSSGKARGAAQPQTAIKSANTVMDSVDHLKDIQQQKEYTRLLESQKSDWRHELTEKAVDGQERENHPFVTVMPTGDENLIQAVKQMKDGVKDKKKELVGSEKGLEEETEKEKYKRLPKAGNTFGKKPSKDYDAAGIVKMAKEKLNIKEEKKKECKDGYKWDSDEGKCVKKKKSSSNTVIIGRGFGGHHHDHDHDDDSDGGGDAGDAGGGDAGGGAMGEMFDYLGQLMIEDLSTDK